jgi:putative oxidoreductase
MSVQSFLWTPATNLQKLEKASSAVILFRFVVGLVFLFEGIQKFLYPETLGIGRFVKIGIPLAQIAAPFVGVVEITGGALLLFGFLTRVAAIPLIINMLVAISTTKIPILLHSGFWAAVHEARVDWSMLLGSVFFLIAGGGKWSVDHLIAVRSKEKKRLNAGIG